MHIYFIMDFLQKITPLLQRQFAVDFVPKLKDMFIKVMIGGSLLKKVNKDDLAGAKKAFLSVLKRYYPTKGINVQ